MSYTNNPNPKVIELMETEQQLVEREQNLKFADYCPSCDTWMKTEHITGNHNQHSYTEYTCESCNRKRRSDSLNITKNKDVFQQFLI